MTSPRYLTSCDDFRAPTGADLLDSDDRRYLVDLAELTDACEPWMLAADATHADVAGEFEVAAGHEVTMRSAAGVVTANADASGSQSFAAEGVCRR